MKAVVKHFQLRYDFNQPVWVPSKEAKSEQQCLKESDGNEGIESKEEPLKNVRMIEEEDGDVAVGPHFSSLDSTLRRRGRRRQPERST